MPKETLGYVRLEWTCPSCGARNPGPQKTCGGCGAPQPQNVQFQQAPDEKLLTDQGEIARAAAGPDVHCPYCGTRNPAGAKACSQCGGDLTGGTARASGAVLGAHRSGPAAPVPCPACGTPNPASALKCSQCGATLTRPEAPPPPPPATPRRRLPLGLILGGIALAVICLLVGFCSLRTEEATGVVRSVAWTRTIAIEGLRAVEHEGWQDEVPADATMRGCTRKIHHTQQDYAPNSEKVCGTPYTVDKGSGYGEVVQDCEYQVYANWCEYSTMEWQRVGEARAEGTGYSPYWPQLQLADGQRPGPQDEAYVVTFEGDGKSYSYRTNDPSEIGRYQVGSRWALKVRGPTVVSLEPR